MHILLGAPGAECEDEESLRRASAGKEPQLNWQSLKNVYQGDHVLIYFWAPTSGIVAAAEALTPARKARDGGFEVHLGKVRWLKESISLSEMRNQFPEWGWLTNCNTSCYVPAEKFTWLWDRAHSRLLSHRVPSTSTAKFGAGFGSAEENKIVEEAAVRRVTKQLQADGFRVVSREKDLVGYDLEATKGSVVRHIEVKGISGGDLQFPITANEVRCARSDPAFYLYAVIDPVSCRNSEIYQLSGRDFLKRFTLRPISFLACSKRSS